jgi:hypothetical protein
MDTDPGMKNTRSALLIESLNKASSIPREDTEGVRIGLSTDGASKRPLLTDAKNWFCIDAAKSLDAVRYTGVVAN